PAHIGAGDLAALVALAGDHDDVDRSGALEEGQRVRDGARGRPAAVPADDDAVELEFLLMGMRHDDQRAARSEQGALDHQLLGGALLAPRLPDDRKVEPAGDASKQVRTTGDARVDGARLGRYATRSGGAL